MRGESWDEYRAIVRRPASILDSAQARELGWVAEAGPVKGSIDEAEKAARRGSEETHASVIGMEHRLISASAWLEIER